MLNFIFYVCHIWKKYFMNDVINLTNDSFNDNIEEKKGYSLVDSVNISAKKA